MRLDELRPNIFQLDESNILNLRDSYDWFSVQEFVMDFVQNIDDMDLRTAVNNKVTAVAKTDEKYHQPADPAKIHNLDRQPEWVHVAIKENNLHVFVITRELIDIRRNVQKFLNLASHDGDKPSIAKFNHCTTFDDMNKLASMYITNRATKAQEADDSLSGLRLHDTIDGFTFYRVLTGIALNREGKTLQNCLEDMKFNHDEFYTVMKNQGGESVVALCADRHSQIDQIKGKQNQPPIKKYCDVVFKYIDNWGYILNRDIRGESAAEEDIDEMGITYNWDTDRFEKKQTWQGDD